MSAETKVAPVPSRSGRARIRHLYEDLPVEGSVALCGHVCRRPSSARRTVAITPEHCVVCLELARERARLG